MKIRSFVHAAVLPLVFLPGMALATAGYFSLGYGVKSSGMGGVGIALPQDGLAAATNPAGTAFVGDRVDLGLTWFMPNRGAEITGSMAPGGNGDYNGNDTRNFFIPELGYVKQFSPQLSGGVAIYGNGGLNTDYGTNPFRCLWWYWQCRGGPVAAVHFAVAGLQDHARSFDRHRREYRLPALQGLWNPPCIWIFFRNRRPT